MKNDEKPIVIIELEDKISEIVFNDNKRNVHFDYKTLEYDVSFSVVESAGVEYKPVSKKQVIAYTNNKANGETFILKIVTCESFELGLRDILTYVENHKKTMNSFTVKWMKKNTQKIENSYFYCEDILEVVTKFFDGKDKSD